MYFSHAKFTIMRTRIIAGNWKMNKTFTEGNILAEDIAGAVRQGDLINGFHPIRIILAPNFILLSRCCSITSDIPGMHVAAQNCHHQDQGAFTGEVSAAMIRSAGAGFVILGHSERRAQFMETPALLAKKTDQAMLHGLRPIFCVGECLPERESGMHFKVVEDQIRGSLFHLNKEAAALLVIAYEPVWAIGTGVNATPSQASEMHGFIRGLFAGKYGSEMADNLSILYGGSCNAVNAKELFARKDVDGGLIGGASLNAADFIQIIQSLPQL